MQEKERQLRGTWIDWWLDPEPVDLRVEHVGENPIFPGERFVRFRVGGKMYTGFFPARYVSQSNMVLSALIVGDVEEGWFVRIPADTFQGGPQVIVPDAEKSTLIMRHRANASA